MASLDQLYSYDEALEDAWRDILNDAFTAESIPAIAYIEQSDFAKVTPFVDIQLRDVHALDQQFLFNDVRYYNAWQGHLISRVTTFRGENSDKQSLIIGKIRAQAANWRDLFGPANLPFHAIQDIKDFGLHRGLIISQQLDWSEVIHRVIFSIKGDAWG